MARKKGQNYYFIGLDTRVLLGLDRGAIFEQIVRVQKVLRSQFHVMEGGNEVKLNLVI